ncbi:MAG TPA: hypothetical protein VHZ33_29050 [Trebonia sp.]|nr:hypothetical protein [Trebonia sp.]
MHLVAFFLDGGDWYGELERFVGVVIVIVVVFGRFVSGGDAGGGVGVAGDGRLAACGVSF